MDIYELFNNYTYTKLVEPISFIISAENECDILLFEQVNVIIIKENFK